LRAHAEAAPEGANSRDPDAARRLQIRGPMQTAAETSDRSSPLLESEGAWPRGLQMFALVTFVLNAGVVLLLAH
jgi:hypothetical protein